MRAFRLVAPNTAALTNVPRPEPAPGEALIRVGGAGVCHSDMHVIDASDALGIPLPFTPGHETVGWIETLGPGVDGFERGAAVAIEVTRRGFGSVEPSAAPHVPTAAPALTPQTFRS